MKKGLILSVMMLGAVAAQATDVTFDGQVRMRTESSNYAFDSDMDAYNMTALRTRIGLSVKPQDGLSIYVQAQDSRTLGGEAAGTSAGLTDDAGLGLHQAYFAWNCLLVDQLTILGGRFEYAKADHRFFGNVGWHNVGRSHEGWALLYRGLSFAEVDVFGVKAAEAYAPNQDVTNLGFYFGNLFGKKIDVFYNMLDFGEDVNEDANVMNTIGVHYDNKYFDKLGVNFNFGTQMGTNEWGGADVDYAGSLLDLDLCYGLDMGILNKVGFGYESRSGWDGSADEWGAWIELFPTAHKFNGYMDLAPGLVGSAGLNDIELNFWGDLPFGGLSYKLDYHMFSSVEDFGAEGNTDVGSEIDLTLKKSVDNFSVDLGYSMFTPADNVAPGGDSMSWMYLMFTAGF